MTEEEYINKVILILHEKNWMDEDFSIECLNRLTKMSSFLDENNRQMIVDLLENFDKFFSDSYTSMLKTIFRTIPIEKFPQTKVFLCGMVKFNDIGKIKSGPALAYLTHELKYHQFFLTKTLNTEPLSESLLNKIDKDSLLIIVDDFLGTGGTFFKMTNYFNKLNTMKDAIIIISLVSMEEGYEKIKNAGFTIYTKEIRKKGISDLMPKEKKDLYINMMNAIEKKINVDDDYKLGYKKSESLVSMIRTPNNTFPVFWKKNDYFQPPFER